MGKSSSKLNKLNDKRRSQSIAWSFRFSTLNKKKMAPIILTQNPHRDINVWLDELDLRQYKEQFSKFIGVEELIHFCEADIKRLGVRNSAHRARIVSSLVALRENYRKGTDRNSIRSNSIIRQSQRHSVSTFNDHIREEADDPSSPTYELLTNSNSKQKQSKSVGDLIEMDNHQSPEDTLALKKALEWELSLDSRDLRSHAWYHGPIPRQRAEECCQQDGDFLIRDCVSQPGNFVLTCKTKGPVLHFVINKILIQPETVYERVQYQFEDDAYDTVPDLITFYVGSGKAISVASGARIQTPCNRSYPLSFYATKYGTQINNNSNHQINNGQHQPNQQYRSASPLNSPSLINAQGFRYPLLGNYTNSYRSPMSSPPRTKRDVPPRLPSKKHRSQSLTPNQSSGQMNNNMNNNNNSSRITTEKYSSGDGVIQGTCTEVTNPSQINNLRSSFETRRLFMSTTEKCNSADGIIQNKSDMSRRSSDERSSSADGVIINNTNNNKSSNNITKTSTLQHGIHRHHSFQSNCSSSSSATLRNTNNNNVDLERNRNGDVQLIDNQSGGSIDERSNDNNNHSGGGGGSQQVGGGSADDAPSPPPKPNRSQSTLLRHENGTSTIDGPVINRIASYHASGSDSGNGSGDSVQSSSTMADLSFITNECAVPHRGGVIIKNPRFLSNSSSLLTLKNYSGNGGGGGQSMMGGNNIIGDFDVVAAEDALMASHQSRLINTAELQSKFDIENFSTLLLPSIENKPLDNSALNTIRIMLSDTGPRVIANHLTRIDIALILGDLDGALPYVTSTNTRDDNYINYLTGVELIAIEQGQRFRRDLLERTECIRLLVAITILTCSSDDERAETLNKWIQVAIDTKTALGNLYGFCAIMLGLCMPQIQKLEPTWHILRQKYTDSAFNFEAKLRPTLKNMNDCSNPQAPNTTVPHLLPYILLRDRGIEDILDPVASPASSLLSTCITPWETNSSDFGLTILFAHLDSIRTFTKNISLYKRNAQIVLEDSSSRLDELLEDAFRTEFHLKFLWGSKGALADAIDRHTKLEQVLSLMAEKFCSSDGVKIYN